MGSRICVYYQIFQFTKSIKNEVVFKKNSFVLFGLGH